MDDAMTLRRSFGQFIAALLLVGLGVQGFLSEVEASHSEHTELGLAVIVLVRMFGLAAIASGAVWMVAIARKVLSP